MNEFTLTQLKIIVERAVRPVRASTTRKRKMREELLAHVCGVFDEELARLGDDRAALERTALRFGNPAEVTSQLQESVPASDGVTRFWEGAPGESVLRGALRLAWTTAAIVLVMSGVALLAERWMSASTSEEVDIFISGLVFLSVWLFAIAFLTHGAGKWLHGPEPLTEWPRISVLKSFTAAWAVLPVRVALIAGTSCFLTLLGIHAATWPTAPDSWSPWALMAAGVLLTGDLAATSVLCAWVMVQSAEERRRYHEEWASLPIDNQKGAPA
jgi:hypothetical protein